MSSLYFRSSLVMLLLALSALQVHAGTPAPEGVKLYIISLANGDQIEGPVTVRFGLQGMGVAPAGVERDKTGHHHLLIDVKEMPAMNRPLPSDDSHRHFGGGQTEVTLDLSKGSHALQLILGDKDHVPFDPPILSEKITIMVK
ncbi:MAG: DUF4399 domain-containing protein [Candidatus Thiodiazotropha sp. (ex Lucinoma borealis)]|nr:DUF4399 domain-containing protein [Candidatus Thiodiazotropha sp. (ex Lucinoma borealis)]MCU7862712.1 DUF4399 domain-containing protein [Candidatus Thiodiazotropha sp. (ex Lucinoma borealis)]